MPTLRRVSKPDDERIGEKVAKFDLVYDKGNEDQAIRLKDETVLVGMDVDVIIMSLVTCDTVGIYVTKEKITLKLSNLSSEAIFVTCPQFQMKNESICRQSNFSKVMENIQFSVSFPIHFSIKIEIQPKPRDTMTFMYEDTDITDFELCADDGSVKVHRIVLAAASPIFKAMLTNDWKEKNEGQIEIPEISKEILECLKKYMYVHTIDKNASVENLLQLLELAKCYMMPDLEEDCSRLIEEKTTENNIGFVFNTASQKKYEKLLVKILQNMSSQKICAIEKEFAMRLPNNLEVMKNMTDD